MKLKILEFLFPAKPVTRKIPVLREVLGVLYLPSRRFEV